MRGRAAAVRDRHRAAQVVHLPPAVFAGNSGASTAETSALQVHVHHQQQMVAASRCMLAQPCEGGRARQHIARAAAATQLRDTLPCYSLHPAARTPACAARLRQVNGLHVVRGVVVADLPAGPVERLYPEQLTLLHGANLHSNRQSCFAAK